jgi:diguanylate cyclase (GGDEF)-like protein
MADKPGNEIIQDHELSYQSIATILDSLDALVYVADMETYELLFCNKYGRDIWGEVQGKTCWQVLQEGQDGPCKFCTNDRLLDKEGNPTGVYVWEFQNTIDKHWYQCRDQAIHWVDGRIVRMEVATDITQRKLSEEQLKAAKKRAENLARKDELTGLDNRRAFFDQGCRIFKQSVRFKRPVSVIMMDIDYFKKINDNYGHSAGDKVLQVIAELLQKMVREIDVVARIGGEEFAFVLPETDREEAVNMAERLRQGIAKTTVTHDERQMQITASFGVSSSLVENETLETMLTKADDALFMAKKKGRDQVRTYG